MAKYDIKLVDVFINGINITHFGDTVAEYTTDGNYVDMRKGLKGDTVTLSKYDYIDKVRISQNPFSPIYKQLQSWSKNHTQLSFQGTDGNTGEKFSSTTGFIETLGKPKDGDDREFTLTFEELI